MIVNIIFLFIGVIPSIFFTWLFTHIYYKKSTKTFNNIIENLYVKKDNKNQVNEETKKFDINITLDKLKKDAPNFWFHFNKMINEKKQSFQIGIKINEFKNIIENLKKLKNEDLIDFKAVNINLSHANVSFNIKNQNKFVI